MDISISSIRQQIEEEDRMARELAEAQSREGSQGLADAENLNGNNSFLRFARWVKS